MKSACSSIASSILSDLKLLIFSIESLSLSLSFLNDEKQNYKPRPINESSYDSLKPDVSRFILDLQPKWT